MSLQTLYRQAREEHLYTYAVKFSGFFFFNDLTIYNTPLSDYDIFN